MTSTNEEESDKTSPSLPLAPYVPRSVLTRLAHGILEASVHVDVDELAHSRHNHLTNSLSWPLQPHFKEMGEGAVFLLDLSGYTRFASTRNADEVARHVNRLFSQMIAVVHSYKHCEVVKFCGDALLCWSCWPPGATVEDDDEDAEEEMLQVVDVDDFADSQGVLDALTEASRALALETAIACSLAVQEQVFAHNMEEEEESPKLSLHVGVVAGSFVELFVGGVSDRFEHLISGTPLEVLGEAVDAAQAGQVVVHTAGDTGALVEKLQEAGRIEGSPLQSDGYLAQKTLKSRQEKLRHAHHSPMDLEHMDASTLERLNEALTAFTPLGFLPAGAEFRQCTILFAALPEFSNDQTVFDDLQHVVEHLQKALDEYGGNVRQLLQDDKGTVAIAVFGLPTRTNEDDAARACKTALTLTQQTSCCAVGIATGDVIVGLVGSKEQRCEYSAVGDAANTAARLMTACPKLDRPVLVCTSTMEAALRTSNHSLAFAETHSIALKGKGTHEAHVPSFAESGQAMEQTFRSKSTYLRGSSLESGHDSKESDDDTELDLVRKRELLEISKAMPGGAVCLTAEAGAGKSTLAASFAEHAVESKLATDVVYTATDSTEVETPFFAFKFIIADFCRRLGGPEAAFLKCKLDPNLAPLINPLLDDNQTLPTNAQCANLGKKGQRQQAISFVVALLREVNHSNENGGSAHKLLVIDDMHWIDECSALVVQELTKTHCSLLATARQLPPSLDGALKEVHLEPLSLEEAKMLASPFMEQLSEEEVYLLFDRSGGNALFFKEMLRASAAGGGAKPNANSLPSTVRGVLISRIDALKPPCIELLKAGSVFGCAFDPKVAAKLMINGDANDLETLTVDCLQAEILEPMTRGNQQDDEKRLRFSHALARDAAYSLIPKGALAELHDKAASHVHTQELVEYHRVLAAEASPTPLRAKLAVQAMSDGTRDRLAMGAISIERARERWEQALSLLETIDDTETRRQLELQMTLDQGRAVVAWVGFGAAEAGEIFTKALSLTHNGIGTEEEIMALAGLWMNAMTNISTKENAQKALEYAEKLRDLAIDPSSILRPGSMDWTVKEIYHVIFTEYGRRGRLREMKRFLDPILAALNPHQGKSVLGHNAETCSTIFGAKVAWLTGQFDEALPIASSGIGITEEAFSVSHSRVWGVAQILAWNGQLDAMDATLEDKALETMPPFHVAVKEVLLIYRGILKAEIPLGTVYIRLLNLESLIPWGEFPFTLCYALIQRGYELQLDAPKTPRMPELCEALSLVLAYWKELRDRSDGWGPGLFHWATGTLQLFEDPSSDSSNNIAHSMFGTGSVIAQEEGALGVMLLIEASRVRMMLHRTNRFPQSLQDAANELSRIRRLCTGDPTIATPLAFADEVARQVGQRRRPGKMIAGALSVSVAAAGAFFMNRRNRR